MLHSFTNDGFGGNYETIVKSPNFWAISRQIFCQNCQEMINGINLQVAELNSIWKVKIYILMVVGEVGWIWWIDGQDLIWFWGQWCKFIVDLLKTSKFFRVGKMKQIDGRDSFFEFCKMRKIDGRVSFSAFCKMRKIDDRDPFLEVRKMVKIDGWDSFS